MTRIGIHFSDPHPEGAPFDDLICRSSYQMFSQFVAERGAQLVIIRGDTYEEDLTFSGAWHFVDDRLELIDSPIICDVVYRKSRRFLPAHNRILNDLTFELTVSDKQTLYGLIPEYMPYTEVFTMGKLDLSHFPGDRVVVKPTRGHAGQGVEVLKKEEVDGRRFEGPHLVQQFIDTSKGIPGLTNEMHDVRVILRDNQPVLSFIRTPASGSYLANVGQGGSVKPLPVDQIPSQMREIALAVDKKLGFTQPRFYAIDFLYNERPYVVELNPQLGIPNPVWEGEAFTEQFFEEVYAWLTSVL